jgi:hypothetical protein
METKFRQAIRMNAISSGLDISRYDEEAVRIGEYIVGIPDGENSKEVIEVKAISRWKEAIGQVLVYSIATNKDPRIIIIEDRLPRKGEISAINKVCASLGIKVEFKKNIDIQKYTSPVRKDWRFRMKKEHLYDIFSPDTTNVRKEELCNMIPIESWRDMTISQLRHLAKSYGITNVNIMNRDDLISVLEDYIDTECLYGNSKYLNIFDTPDRKKKIQ